MSNESRQSELDLIAGLRSESIPVLMGKLMREAAVRLEEYREALDTIRDAVLNERHQLAEMNAGSDIINSVLGIIDDHDPRHFTAPIVTVIPATTEPPVDPGEGFRLLGDNEVTIATDERNYQFLMADGSRWEQLGTANSKMVGLTPEQLRKTWYGIVIRRRKESTLAPHTFNPFTTRDGSTACSVCHATPSDPIHQESGPGISV